MGVLEVFLVEIGKFKAYFVAHQYTQSSYYPEVYE
jgi:hypothetical protein